MPCVQGISRMSIDATAQRASRWRAIILSAILLLLRLPYLDHPVPTHPDELEFLAAIDFPKPYPVHQPGYPLWVAMGTMMHAIGFTPYTAYQVWSLLASVVAPLLLYLGLRRHVDEPVAWWVAAAFGLCPLTWFLSASVQTYLAAAAAAVFVLGLSHEAGLQRCRRSVLLAAVALTLTIPLRPDLVLWVGPVLLYAAIRVGLRRTWPAMVLVCLGVLVFMLLSSRLYATPEALVAGPFDGPSLRHTFDVLLGTSVFRLGLVDGLLRSAFKLCGYLGWSLGPAGLALVLCACRRPVDSAIQIRPETRVTLALAIAPPLLFFLTMHMSEAGHMFLLPPLYGLLALLLVTRFGRQSARRIAMAVAVISMAQFTLYPWSTTSTGAKRVIDAKVAFVSGRGLLHINEREKIHRMGDTWPTPAHSR